MTYYNLYHADGGCIGLDIPGDSPRGALEHVLNHGRAGVDAKTYQACMPVGSLVIVTVTSGGNPRLFRVGPPPPQPRFTVEPVT